MIKKTITYLESRRPLLITALIVMTLITLYFTLFPADKMVKAAIFKYDKIGHFLIFGTWTFLLGLTLLVSKKKKLPLFLIFISGSIFGITVEILQEVMPFGRSMDLYDAAADIAGCFVAVLILKIITAQEDQDQSASEKS